MNNTFSAEELANLVGMVDAQLVEVRSQPQAFGKTAIGEMRALRSQLVGQVGAIEVAVGEPTDGFFGDRGACDGDYFAFGVADVL